MLLTIYLSEAECRTYPARAGELKTAARRLAALRGRRFAQLVHVDGRILAVVEVCGAARG